jgi:tRNA(Ile)-lysidine synthase
MAERGRLVLLRPLLDCTRKSLRECLIHRHQDWCEDPGNVNPVYTRTRLGRLLADVTALPGSDLETVALAARRLQRADDALSGVTTALADAGMTVSPFGFVTFAADFFAPLHDELVLRIIERAIRIVRGRHVTYRLRSLENFVDDLRGGSLPPSVTIAGCQLQRRGGAISVFREAGRGGMPVESLAGRRELVWDDRFTVRDTMPEQPLAEADSVEVRVLGEIGWRAVTRQGALPDGISLPAVIRNSLPGLWIGGKLAAVPLFSHVTDGMGIAPGRFEMVFMHN